MVVGVMYLTSGMLAVIVLNHLLHHLLLRTTRFIMLLIVVTSFWMESIRGLNSPLLTPLGHIESLPDGQDQECVVDLRSGLC